MTTALSTVTDAAADSDDLTIPQPAAKRGRFGKLPEGSEIERVNANNLPSVQSLTADEINVWVARVEALPSRQRSGKKVAAFLAELYAIRSAANRSDQVIIAAFAQQSEQLAQTNQDMREMIEGCISEVETLNTFADSINRLSAAFGRDDSSDGFTDGAALFNSLIAK